MTWVLVSSPTQTMWRAANMAGNFVAALFKCVFVALFSVSVWCNDIEDEAIAFEPVSGAVKFGVAETNGTGTEEKFLIYDVNPGEGFNLRRDVYMRVANMMELLNKNQKWTLVVPPWRKLYHWKSSVEQNAFPWKKFFDLPSLNRYVPVIEFEDYVKQTGGPVIDEIIYLQRYAEGWTDGKWEEKIDERDCIDRPAYRKDDKGLYRGHFWGVPEVYARKFKCVSAQGTSAILVPVLEKIKSRWVLKLFCIEFPPSLDFCWRTFVPFNEQSNLFKFIQPCGTISFVLTLIHMNIWITIETGFWRLWTGPFAVAWS